MQNSHPSSTDPQQAGWEPDWERLLPRQVFQELILTLCRALPCAPGERQAVRRRREQEAVAALAALQPGNAAEGRMAAQYVAANAWGLDCLRLARERQLERDVARKHTAQAASLMREAKSALRQLLQMQAARRKTEADEVAANRAAWVEHCLIGIMEEALAAEADVEAEADNAAAPAPAGGDSGRQAKTKDAAEDAALVRAVLKYASESHERGFETGMGFSGVADRKG